MTFLTGILKPVIPSVSEGSLKDRLVLTHGDLLLTLGMTI